MNAWLLLGIAILAEVTATTAMKASDGLTRLAPSLVTFAGYGVAFWCLAIAIKTIPVGIAYAIWSGVGLVLITVLAWVLFRQTLDLAAVAGMALILAGVFVIQLFSKTAS